ncbi:MAG: helix-turn-helix transcriptional regulator [Candidatus Lustribacter sp.]|jgi:AraC-like DNA-binding protein
MQSLDGRIVVMRPGALAAGAVIRGTQAHSHQGPGKELIAGHTMMLFLARGEGTYRVHNRTGVLRPNTLLAAPAGAFACEFSDDRELYVLAVREAVDGVDDKHAFSPFVDRRLSTSDGRRWKERMEDFADRATAGRIDADDVQALRDAVVPYVWRREPNGARETLTGVFGSIWNHVAEPLTLERLATDVGYTANYLNDLTREHTGRPLGSWIADMRMARARAALEHTDLPVAQAGALAGYDDPAYFSRAFRRVHGVPPATWRIAMRPVDARYPDVTIPIDFLHEMELHAALPQRAYSFAS